MFDQVQQFGEHGHWEQPGGRVLPVPSLVVDEHGSKVLICGNFIPQEAWKQSAAQGAIALLRVIGGPFSIALTEEFVKHRRENHLAASYELSEDHWIPIEWDGDIWAMAERAKERQVVKTSQFVHLHTHTEYSPLDGLSTMKEVCETIAADGQQAFAVTDHGNCAGHPDAQLTAREFGLKPIFGMEGYFVDDVSVQEDQFDYWHLVLLAMDNQGLKNLWALSTESYRDGFYGKPRFDWDMLTRLNSGLIVTTACLGGPVLKPYMAGDEERALQNLARLGDTFGDRLYIELHANHLEKQIVANQWLNKVAAQYHVPVIGVADSHYALPSDRIAHQTWLTMTTHKDNSDDEDAMFGGGQDYHLLTTEEMQNSLHYLGSQLAMTAIANTHLVAERCNAEIVPKKGMPRYSRPTKEHPDTEARDAERLMDMVLERWDERVTSRVPPEEQEPYFKQTAYEMKMLIDKGFPGYYLITADFVNWAKRGGVLVGPGRGSGAASIVAFIIGITEIDPVEGMLNPDRFMTPGRKSLPDFDIDFPSSRSDMMVDYVQQRWDPAHVAQVGTVLRLKNKAVFKDVQRAIAARLPGESYGAVVLINKLVDQAEASTAGLGLEWDDLMAQIGDLLAPFQQAMPELFALAERFRSRLRTYARHAAGMIIDPDQSLVGELPMRNGEPGKPMVTQWDMSVLEPLGYVKWDFLKLRNLDTLQETLDLIKAEQGTSINVYKWHYEYEDPEVYDELAAGHTMGVFQIETSLGTATTKKMRPRSRHELADVITVGRPGPLRSGLDNLYIRRKDGIEPISYADPRLEEVLARTYGVMLYQEDIMAICTKLAGYDADEADNVRKILGKKKVELVEAEGKRFIARAVANDTARPVAEAIWAQMAEFARYSFNRAHAYAYGTLGLWTAWFRVHYPREFLTASMATVDGDRIPQFVTEAKRLGYRVLPPDINESKVGFRGVGLEVRYGLQGISGIGLGSAMDVLVGQPYTSYDDFLERKGPKCNMGHVKKLVRIGAFDSIEPNRRALEFRLLDNESGESTKCVFKDTTILNSHNLPCHYDWDNEPVVLGKTNKPLKQKPIPKRCTKACRHYTPPEPKDYSDVEPYTDEGIRDIEHEMLGIFLSSSPFDRIKPEILAQLMTAEDIELAPIGSHPAIGIVHSARPDPRGRDFGFVTFNTPVGDLSCIVFSQQWKVYQPLFRKRQMALLEIHKSDQDRFRLVQFQPI